jgi:hypothetical protein
MHFRARVIPVAVRFVLDLAGRTRTVVDHDALTEPQFGNVLLAWKNLIRERRRRQRDQGNAAEKPDCLAHGVSYLHG